MCLTYLEGNDDVSTTRSREQTQIVLFLLAQYLYNQSDRMVDSMH